jgi:hypothetical protein
MRTRSGKSQQIQPLKGSKLVAAKHANSGSSERSSQLYDQHKQTTNIKMTPAGRLDHAKQVGV